MHQDEVHQMVATIKRVQREGANKGKKVPIGPLTSDISFYHEAESGAWSQGYQFVQIASSNAPVIKATYHVKIEVTMKPTFGLKCLTKTMQIPVRVMEPGRANRQRLPDLTKR